MERRKGETKEEYARKINETKWNPSGQARGRDFTTQATRTLRDHTVCHEGPSGRTPLKRHPSRVLGASLAAPPDSYQPRSRARPPPLGRH